MLFFLSDQPENLTKASSLSLPYDPSTQEGKKKKKTNKKKKKKNKENEKEKEKDNKNNNKKKQQMYSTVEQQTDASHEGENRQTNISSTHRKHTEHKQDILLYGM